MHPFQIPFGRSPRNQDHIPRQTVGPLLSPIDGPLAVARVTGSRASLLQAWRRIRLQLGFWLVTLLLAVITARVVEQAGKPYPSQWGSLVDVVVATEPIGAGQKIAVTAIQMRSVPSAFAPPRSARSLLDVNGRVASVAIPTGMPINLANAIPASTSAVVASIGRGRRGIGLQADAVPPGLQAGDTVDVLVASDGDGSTVAVFRNAQVVLIDTTGVLVAVPTDDAQRLAAARILGRASLVIVGG